MLFKNKKKKTLRKNKKPNSFLIRLLVASKEKEFLIDNLSMLMNSGLTVLRSLKTIEKDIKSKFLKKIIKEMALEIENGLSVSKALKATGLFSGYAISLIKIGEESGRLAENLKVISKQEKKNRTFKGKIRSAMMYPTLVLGISLFIGVGIAWFILPRLASVFNSLDIELPLVTQVLMTFGDFLANYGKIFIPSLFFGLFLIFYFVFIFSKTKFIGQKILIDLPGIKNLIIETEVARFGFLFGTLLEAGVPIVTALNSLVDSTSVRDYKKLFSQIKKEISNGISLQAGFRNYPKSEKLIPRTVQQMIFSGENSGYLSETLVDIGHSYEEKIDNTSKNLAVLLEPVMLFFVWLGVVSLALAVILPIYSLVGGLNEPPATISEQKPTVEKNIEKINDEEITEENETELPKIKILETGLGFLNIREKASLESEIVGRVIPGEEYENTGQKEEWYEIIYEKGKEEIKDKKGWVFGEYVELLKTEEENESKINQEESKINEGENYDQ